MNIILDLPVSAHLDTFVTGRHHTLSHSKTYTLRELLETARASGNSRYGSDNKVLDETMPVRDLLDWHADYNWDLSDRNETYTVSRLYRNEAGLVTDASRLLVPDYDSADEAIEAVCEDCSFEEFPALHDIEIYCQFTGHTIVGYYLNGEFHVEFNGDRKDAEMTILAEA